MTKMKWKFSFYINLTKNNFRLDEMLSKIKDPQKRRPIKP